MAQDDKKSFVAYLSWFDALEEYSDAEVGQLMRALARYAKNRRKTRIFRPWDACQLEIYVQRRKTGV